MMPIPILPLSRLSTAARRRSRIAASFVLLMLVAACHSNQGRESNRILTTIDKLSGISSPKSNLPVCVRASVTYYNPKTNLLFVQDETKAMVLDNPEPNLGLKTGDLVEITGSFDKGVGGVSSPQVKVLRQGAMPAPMTISVDQLEGSARSGELIEIQGVIHSTYEQDDSLVLKLVTEDHTVIRTEILDFRYCHDPNSLVDSIVTVRGVCRAVTDPDVTAARIQVLVSGFEQVTIDKSSPEDPFAIAPLSLNELAQSPHQVFAHRMRIQGVVVKQRLGEFLIINSGDHDVRIDTLQMTPVDVGQRIDAIGFVAAPGSAASFEDARFRTLDATPQVGREDGAHQTPNLSPASVLTAVQQIRNLTSNQARNGYAVRVEAVVTFYNPKRFLMFIQDSTGGIFVYCKPFRFDVKSGDLVRVEGVTNPGDFAPYIECRRADFIRSASMPTPQQPSIERLVSGEQDSQWIELRGTVHSAVKRGMDVFLEVFGDIGPFQVEIPTLPDAAVPIQLVDAEVRIRGACGTHFNHKRQFLGVRLFAPGPDYITVEKSGPEDLFSAPVQPIATLMQFSFDGKSSHRAQVKGVVTLQRPGQGLFVLDETGGVYVETEQKNLVEPGDVVQVVGFPAHREYSPILQTGIFKKVGADIAPSSSDASAEDIMAGGYDAQPVRMRATLIDFIDTTAERVLTLQSGRFTFNAIVVGTEKDEGSLRGLRNGSLLQLSGLCSIQADATINPVVPRSFRIFVASPADITVVKSAPWWTLKHTIGAITSLSVVMCFSLAWIRTLRKRVASQTTVIAEQLEKETSLRLENQLRRAQKMDSLGTLAGGIAHDFNNILAATIGYTELAADEFPAEHKGQSHLAQVLKASHRAQELVRQILTFSRQREQERKPMKLPQILDEVLKLLRASIPSTIEIRTNIDSEAPLLLGDPGQIHQVMMNLGTNAMHAMGERVGILEVTLLTLDIDDDFARTNPDLRVGKYLRLIVSDTGCGMDKYTMERVFEPFFTTKEPGQGTGLGLATVYGIVKNHEGAISVYSEPGKGTTFNIYFPVVEAVEIKQVSQAVPVPNGRGQHILFVDDEEQLAVLGKKRLERLGYRVTSYTSSPEALEAFRKEPDEFDLIITDYTMPRLDGADLAKYVLNVRPEMPVILVTGYSSTMTPKRATSIGIQELLMKPTTAQTIGEAVNRALAE